MPARFPAREPAGLPRALCVAALALGPVTFAAAQPAPASAGRAEPQVDRRVAEDDQVRIEEVRVRGEVRSITVAPKMAGVRPYEIQPGSAARDPSQPGTAGSSGQRVWNLLRF